MAGTHAGAEVAQPLGSGPADEGTGAELVAEADAVVAGVGLGYGSEQARGVPVEVAAVDEHAPEGHPVAAQELGGRVHHDVGAVLEGPDQVRGREGGVHHQRQAMLVGDVGHRSDVENLDAGIAERLGEHEAGVGADGGRELVGLAGVHERGGNAEAGQGQVEHVVGSAVDVAAGHDVPARVHEGGHGQEEGGLPAGGGHRAHPALQRRDPLLEHGYGGIGDPGVDVAGDLEVEQPGGVVGVLEGVRRGEVDGHGPGPGGGVAVLSGVEAEGVEAKEVGLYHTGEPRGRADSRGSASISQCAERGRGPSGPRAQRTGAGNMRPNASRPSPYRLGGNRSWRGPRVGGEGLGPSVGGLVPARLGRLSGQRPVR